MYGWTFHYVLYKLTFAQAITIIDVHNERIKREQEESEKRQRRADNGAFDPREAPAMDDVENLPSANELKRAFAGMFV